jgi:hypothetical protein
MELNGRPGFGDKAGGTATHSADRLGPQTAVSDCPVLCKGLHVLHPFALDTDEKLRLRVVLEHGLAVPISARTVSEIKDACDVNRYTGTVGQRLEARFRLLFSIWHEWHQTHEPPHGQPQNDQPKEGYPQICGWVPERCLRLDPGAEQQQLPGDHDRTEAETENYEPHEDWVG